MKHIKNIIANNIYMMKIVVSVAPFYVIGSMIVALLNSAIDILGDVLLTKYVIDSVQFQTSYSEVLRFI